MAADPPQIIEAPRLPELYRAVCRYAGVPQPPAAAGEERFVFRSGSEPPGLLAGLLEEGLVDDQAEALPGGPAETVATDRLAAGQVVVGEGFDIPCPAAEELGWAASPAGGRVLLFAVERLDAAGALLGVTWAAVPYEEPPAGAPFRAAVLRQECDRAGASGG
jgi:hypothetical protein